MREVVKLGFARDYIMDSVRNRAQNKVRGQGVCGGGGCACVHVVGGLGASATVLCCARTRSRPKCPLTPAPLPPCLASQAAVAYHLLADNRRRMPSSAYLKEEMTEAGDVRMQVGRTGGGWLFVGGCARGAATRAAPSRAPACTRRQPAAPVPAHPPPLLTPPPLPTCSTPLA